MDSAFPSTVLSANPDDAINTENHTWGNYFLAAFKGTAEYMEYKKLGDRPAGFQAMVHGTVPLGWPGAAGCDLYCLLDLYC